MLAKRQRLPIQSVARLSGRIVRGGPFQLKVFSTNLPYSRFGVIIPKAIAAKATERNRLKRIAFEVFSAQASKMQTPNDILLIASKGAPKEKGAMIDGLVTLLNQLTD